MGNKVGTYLPVECVHKGGETNTRAPPLSCCPSINEDDHAQDTQEKQQSDHHGIGNPLTFFCEICVDQKPLNESFNVKGCTHFYCSNCMAQYVVSKLQDNVLYIHCPVSNCRGVLEPEYCRAILPVEAFDRWGDALCESLILGSQKFYCPFIDCWAPLHFDATPRGVIRKPNTKCPHCRRVFCVRCKVPWHSGIDCKKFQKLNKREIGREDRMMKDLAKRMNWMRCRNCKIYVEKIGGCMHMTCRCGFDFCYSCGAPPDSTFHKFSIKYRRAITASLHQSPTFFIDLSQSQHLDDDDDEDPDDDVQVVGIKPAVQTPFSLRGPFFTEIGQSSNSKSDTPSPPFMCEICAEPKPMEESFNINGCTHFYCIECMIKYVASMLQENITCIRCPVSNCNGLLEPEYCRAILPLEVFERWGSALCESVILGSEKFYCPFKDCSALLINDGGEVITQSECPNCWRMFCAQCTASWHSGIDCAEFQRLNKDEREREDIMMMQLAKNKSWKGCPKCRFYVEKSQGCMYMKCRCGFAFCYNCGAPSTTNSHLCSMCAFVGVSLEGNIVTTRMDTNLHFYGDPYLTTADILLGTVDRPKAAEPLYTALDDLYSKLRGYSKLRC